MTRLELARKGQATGDLYEVARDEGLDIETLRTLLAQGRTVVIRNRHRHVRPLGVGAATRVKVNANLGSSDCASDTGLEQEKLARAVRAGADAIMDLSTGLERDTSRDRMLALSPVVVGTVPLYGAMAKVANEAAEIWKPTP